MDILKVLKHKIMCKHKLQEHTKARIYEEAAEEIENLRAFAQFIIDGYHNHDLNHVDFRVGAYKNANKALEKTPVEEELIKDLFGKCE